MKPSVPSIKDQEVALKKILVTSFRRTIKEDYDIISQYNNTEKLATNIPDATIEAISAVLTESVIDYNSQKNKTNFEIYHDRIMNILGSLHQSGNSRATGLGLANIQANKSLRPAATGLKNSPTQIV
jgi:hypothetical protein